MLSLRGVREFVKPAEINPSNLQCYAVLVSLSLSLFSHTLLSFSPQDNSIARQVLQIEKGANGAAK